MEHCHGKATPGDQVFHTSLGLRQQIDQLDAVLMGKGFADPRELFIELILEIRFAYSCQRSASLRSFSPAKNPSILWLHTSR